MRVIAVMNQKGGIGKTMTASSIAYILGREKKVLICDGDQQGNISLLYNRYDPEGQGMSELFENHQAAGGTYATTDLIQTTPYRNIDIIPANGYLMQTNALLLQEKGEDQILRFAAAMKEVATVYDYCVVDCGLQMDMVATNVMPVADLVIVPVKAGGFEVKAIDDMKSQIEAFESINPNIHMMVLMTMWKKNKTALQVEEWLRTESGYKCFNTIVKNSIAAENSTIAFKPLPEYSKRSVTTKDYWRVVEQVIQELKLTELQEVLEGRDKWEFTKK